MNKHLNRFLSLSDKDEIALLFKEGKSINIFPIKVVWINHKSEEKGTKLLIAVPKKAIKKAVDRNKIKRQLKEIYLKNILNKYTRDKNYNLGIIYIADKKVTFNTLESILIKIFNELTNSQ